MHKENRKWILIHIMGVNTFQSIFLNSLAYLDALWFKFSFHIICKKCLPTILSRCSYISTKILLYGDFSNQFVNYD